MILQVGGFAWENCGDKKNPVVLQSLSVAPDPISIPGSLRVSAAVSSSKTMDAPVKVCAGDASEEDRVPETTGSSEMPSSGYGNRAQSGTGLSTLGSVSQDGATRLVRPVMGADSPEGSVSQWEKPLELCLVLGTS